MITGSAARLHRVHQAPKRFASPDGFEAFDNPDHEKLFMSVRVATTGRPGELWLVLEHATRALCPLAERKFARVLAPDRRPAHVRAGPLLQGGCAGAPNVVRP